jgi:hypothetical protein
MILTSLAILASGLWAFVLCAFDRFDQLDVDSTRPVAGLVRLGPARTAQPGGREWADSVAGRKSRGGGGYKAWGGYDRLCLCCPVDRPWMDTSLGLVHMAALQVSGALTQLAVTHSSNV